jgi:hypothetical protein
MGWRGVLTERAPSLRAVAKRRYRLLEEGNRGVLEGVWGQSKAVTYLIAEPRGLFRRVNRDPS